MSVADDRQCQIIHRVGLLYAATKKPVTLHSSDFDFLQKRKAIDSQGKVKGFPVLRR